MSTEMRCHSRTSSAKSSQPFESTPSQTKIKLHNSHFVKSGFRKCSNEQLPSQFESFLISPYLCIHSDSPSSIHYGVIKNDCRGFNNLSYTNNTLVIGICSCSDGSRNSVFFYDVWCAVVMHFSTWSAVY
jgi:hypothetical protein